VLALTREQKTRDRNIQTKSKLLGTALLRCSSCPLDGEVIVPPEGDRHAKIALVGEGPGFQEVQRGKPFIGPAGEQLGWLLRQTGCKVKRSQLWISNCGLCLPRSGWRDLQAENPTYFTKKDALVTSTQETCRPRLLAELGIVKPRAIVAIGGFALRALTGLRGVQRCHGAVIPVDLGYGQTYVVPMLHPAALLRRPKDTDGVIRVLRRALQLADRAPDYSNYKVVRVSPLHQQGADAALDELAVLVDQVLDAGDDIAVDVETSSEDARKALLTVVGFASARLRVGVSVSILMWDRLTRSFVRCWTPEQRGRLQELLGRLLGSKLRKWYWNYRFDVTVLEREFPSLSGPHADGLHLHWLIQPECDHHLSFAVQSYLDAPPWKAVFWDKQDAGEATNDDLLDYNAQDAIETIRVVPPLQHEVAKRGNAHLVDHQMKVAELARRAEGYGIPLDPDAWTRLRGEYLAKQQSCLAIMREEIAGKHCEAELEDHVHAQRMAAAEKRARLTGAEHRDPERWTVGAAEFTPRSKFHARWYLYEHLALPVTRMTAGGADKNKEQQESSTSYKGVLSWLNNPLVKAYVDFSEYDSKLSTLDALWGKVEIADGWPRLFVSWNTTGMKGTRWTSKIVNMQNWESGMRVLLKALPGRVWVGADADQIEYRICAALAGIPELLHLFNAPAYDETVEEWKKYDPAYDAHSLVAAIVFGNAYLTADLKTKKKWRTLVKRVVYAMFYGGLPPKILQSLLEDRRLPSELRATLTLERVELIWQGFKRRFPQWDKWAEQEMTSVRTTGCQDIPPFGQKRWWLLDQLEENKIRNTPIQLAAGHVCNYIFVHIQDRIDAEGLDSQMTIHAHDALCLDTKEEHAQRVAQIVNEEFRLVFPGPAGSVAIRGTAKIGPTVADI